MVSSAAQRDPRRGSDRFLAEEDEFGVVWGIAFDVEAGEVRAGGDRMTVVDLRPSQRVRCAPGWSGASTSVRMRWPWTL